jgi:hypothetical protein
MTYFVDFGRPIKVVSSLSGIALFGFSLSLVISGEVDIVLPLAFFCWGALMVVFSMGLQKQMLFEAEKCIGVYVDSAKAICALFDNRWEVCFSYRSRSFAKVDLISPQQNRYCIGLLSVRSSAFKTLVKVDNSLKRGCNEPTRS